MKKVIRLTENDLARIVRRVIREQEELASVEVSDEDFDDELDNVDENDATGLEKLINRLGDNIRRYKGRNASKLRRMLQKHSGRNPKFRDALMKCPKWK